MSDDHAFGDAGGPAVLLIGASARAAAFSALRSGIRPVCVDRYADVDLAVAAEVIPVDDYPQGLREAVDSLESHPAIYLGGLENECELLANLAQRGPLFGNPVSVLETVRDPLHLAEAFAKARFPCLEVRPGDDPPERDGSWLIRPLRGAGGRNIAVWNEAASTPDEPFFFQKLQEGDSYSAVFIAPPDRSDVRFVGMTRQLVGAEPLHAPPFAWCGSVGPVVLSVETEHLIRRMGNYLSWRLGLCGLFGCDLVVDDEGTPWFTEVNPRYPASTEVLEHIGGFTLVGDHCAMFDPEWRELPAEPPSRVHALGKFVLYASRPLTAPQPGEWLDESDLPKAEAWRETPRVTDIPPGGTRIETGEPICTVHTVGDSATSCLQQAPEAVNRIESRLYAAANT